MNDLSKYHYRVKRRYRKARALKKLLDSVGVEVPQEYGPIDMTRKTFCVRVIDNLCARYGTDNVRLALRLLTETSEENARWLRANVITALTVIVTNHDYGRLGLALFDAMDGVDVGSLVLFAGSLSKTGQAQILTGLIAGELRRNLGELA
jgi:hypothetical protein